MSLLASILIGILILAVVPVSVAYGSLAGGGVGLLLLIALIVALAGKL